MRPHVEIIDFLCVAKSSDAKCMTQPDEPEFETIALEWLGIDQFFLDIQSCKKNTYLGIDQSLKLAMGRWLDMKNVF